MSVVTVGCVRPSQRPSRVYISDIVGRFWDPPEYAGERYARS